MGMSPAEQMSRREQALSLAHYSMPSHLHGETNYPTLLFARAEQFLAWVEQPVSRPAVQSAGASS